MFKWHCEGVPKLPPFITDSDAIGRIGRNDAYRLRGKGLRQQTALGHGEGRGRESGDIESYGQTFPVASLEHDVSVGGDALVLRDVLMQESRDVLR